MLTKIKIQNFQAHRQREIELGKVTVFIGLTDSGKSGLIRFLRWICLNKPPSKEDGFISWGAKECVGELEVDGHTIIRTKGKGVNSYELDGKKFSVLIPSVPDEISDLLNVTLENFQSQHEPHFWFSLTSGQVAKELNKIVDLEAIDTSLANAAAHTKKSKTNVELIEERLQKASQQRKELEWVVEVSHKYKKLEKGLEEIQEQKEILSKKISDVQELIRILESKEKISKLLDKMKKVLREGEELVQKRKEIEQKINSLKLVEQTALKLKSIREQLKKAQQEYAEKTEGQLCPLCEKEM